MARTTIDYNILTRTARAELAHKTARSGVSNKPYYRTVAGRIALGWQAPENAISAGRWVARKSFGGGQYSVQQIGSADDISAADGVRVLSFEQATIAALAKFHADKPTAKGDLTVRDAIDGYLAACESNHVEAMRREADRVICGSVHTDKGRAKVAELTRAQLTRWRAEVVANLQKNKRAAIAAGKAPESEDEIVRKSKDSANKSVTLFKSALNHAFESPANGLKTDIEWRVGLKLFRGVGRARLHHYTQDEMQQLIDASPDRDFAVLLTGGYLIGGRYGELRAANVGDFNARAGVLRLDGKTGERFVPLSIETAQFVAEQCRNKLPTAPLFMRANGTRWGKCSHTRPMKRALKAAGFDLKATFYATRHSHISRCIESNMPTKMIAENCGTSIYMIEKNYAHILAAVKIDYLNRAGLRINPAPLKVAA